LSRRSMPRSSANQVPARSGRAVRAEARRSTSERRDRDARGPEPLA
jgi:hypothetical protein